MPTIWQVPGALWQQIQSLVEQYDPPKCTGRKRIDVYLALDAIIFRLRGGFHPGIATVLEGFRWKDQ